jgi:nucleolar pre-ribosomal-associated protein 1
MLKAGFIRTQLTALMAPRLISPLSRADAAANARTAFSRLAHALFVANTYVSAQPNFVEPLLGFYRASMDEADQLVLAMFAAFENQRHLSVTSIFRHWGNASGRALDALSALDPARVFATCSAFPLRRGVGGTAAAPQEDIYDPAFVLPLLSAVVLDDEMQPLDWVELLRTNALGLAVCALSSRDAGMRTLAGWLLKTTLEKVHNVAFHEKLQLVHTLELVAHSIDPPTVPAETEGPPSEVPFKFNQSRLPTLITLFIAHALRGIAHPAHFIFPISSRFLLQRAVLDVADVPLLYGMLYASGDTGRRERGWIVRLLRDGTRSEADYRLLARRNTLALLATLFASSTDAIFRRAILNAILSAARIPSGARALLRAHLPWIAAQWDAAPTRPNPDEVRDALLAILDAAAAAGLPAETEAVRTRITANLARLLATAAEGADAARLEVLARIALRLAPNADAVPALVARLDALGDSHAATTELLFRASLYLPTPLSASAAKAVKTLTARVAQLDTPIGAWAREQARS